MPLNTRAAHTMGKALLVAVMLCSSLMGTRLASLRQSHLEVAYAQDDPVTTINRLAKAVHIQNYRTQNITRWIGGDLGPPDSSELGVPAGSMVENWYFTGLYDESVHVGPTDLRRPVLINIWASWCSPCGTSFRFWRNWRSTRQPISTCGS